ncbi:gamma-glutamyltransferase [Azospirillum sp. TSO22-1]|uniref:gamma-glutamyltransferase n=1 Tax=Azospirillum sp. TSO22-1 TaxID=716789 RepID=UPI000D60C383|nr:gamma-glutamyltransferase [Azospirillum sp. TSO22-1]PWC56229.1 gamma-glutamyltransferase [Azospirillum sp. TSO22-1]
MKSQFAPGWRLLAGAGLVALLPLSAVAQTTTAPAAGMQTPEGATGRTARTLGTAAKYMAAAANPLAAEAGREILRAGGNAVDAAIATQLVLGLVEPQSSGIGGGAFLVFYDGKAGKLTTYDGRETAPAAARAERFMGADGKPMPFYDAVVGGRSVGVPGTVKLLEAVHKAHGKLPWPRLFERAVRLASEGFTVSPRLNGLLGQEKYLAKNDPKAAAYFYQPDGTPKPVGFLLRNPEYATTLQAIAEKGASAFYEGSVAAEIVRTVTSHAANPGDMTEADLKAYQVKERPAVCGTYRVYTICGMGPPSSGAVAVQQILGALEPVDMAALKNAPVEAAHRFAEAGRLAFADRGQYLGDPDFVKVPVKGLIDSGYIQSRARLIDPAKSMGKANPGDPPFQQGARMGASEGIEKGTSHIAIIDSDGNAVSMTTTIEDQFGARLMTRGFLLNNELTDFALNPVENGQPVANRVEAGKRPRSSMAPTIVFKDGRLYAVVGSPGGSAIINYVAKTLVALLDWDMDPQQAVDLANFGSRNGPTELEKGTEAEAWAPALEAKGHPVKVLELTSGTQAILVTPAGLTGGADSRREGVAVGD